MRQTEQKQEVERESAETMKRELYIWKGLIKETATKGRMKSVQDRGKQ